MNRKLIELIERIGYINAHGERVCGTAALLHVLHCPVRSMRPEHVRLGKVYVERCLSA